MVRPIIKISLLAVLFLGLISVIAFNIYSKEKAVLFSATDGELTETEDGSYFTVTITNRGDKPLKIDGCGYNDVRCEVGCQDKMEVNPGEEFEAQIRCEKGVTLEEARLSGFYINHRSDGQSQSQTSSSGTPGFPSLNTGSPSISAGGSGPGLTTTQSGSQQAGNPGAGTGLGTGIQTPSNLANPIFIEISGSTSRGNFMITDTTPTIRADVPQFPALATSMNCRWDTNDLAFTAMQSSCSINEDIIICNLPLQTQGPHSYSISCMASAANPIAQNGPSNNLDISGVIDAGSPLIYRTSLSPPSGYVFEAGINSFVAYFTTDESATCRASAASGENSPETNYYLMDILCDNGVNHDCVINLGAQGTTTNVNFACVDEYSNVGLAAGFLYERSIAVSGRPVIFSINPSSGSGGSSAPDNNDAVAPDEGGDGGVGGAPVAEVIRDFDSNKTLFESVVDWFKKLFK